MLCADQSITVITRTYDGKTDTESEVKTALSGVSVHSGLAATPSTGGIAAADVVKIRIPSPLPAGTALAVGGTVVVGGKPMTILTVHDNTKRRFAPHWYLEAK